MIPPDYSGCAMEVVRRLIARGIRDLHLVGAPTGGFQADMLIGAGCVATLEVAAVTLGEYGPPGRFAAAVKSRRDPPARFYLSRDPCRNAGRREGYPLHPPAWRDRLRYPEEPSRLEGDREPLRRGRSRPDPAATPRYVRISPCFMPAPPTATAMSGSVCAAS